MGNMGPPGPGSAVDWVDAMSDWAAEAVTLLVQLALVCYLMAPDPRPET